jgi:hypothetical protein
MHSYYHLVPLVCCYCSVGYLSDLIDYSRSSYFVIDGEAFGFTHGCGVQV